MGSKNVILDVVGTLVSHDPMSDAVEARLGPRLRAAGVPARLLVNGGIETAEREYTSPAPSGRYVPFHRAFKLLFWRAHTASPSAG